MNNPLSFNTDVFAQSLQGLQTFDPPSSGWNDGNSAYFIAGNSEYRADKPQVTAGTLTLTTQIRNDYNALFDAMIAALPSLNLPAEQQQTITNTINSWRSALDAQSELPSLMVSTQITHIINNNKDDHCALQTTVVWLADLNIFLPINYATAYTWGVDVYAVISSGDLSNALTFQTIMSLGAEHLALGIAMDPEGMLISILTTVAFDIYLDAVHAIDHASDDGGKLYFPAVVAQCFVRVLGAISSPATTTTKTSVPLPRASSFSQMWKANYDSSNVLDDTDYPWYSNEIDVQNNYYYTLNLPELGWLPFGTGLLLSFKLAVGNRTNGYASIMMVVSNNGSLLGCAGAMQLGDDDTIVPIPTLWRTDQTSNNQLIEDFTQAILIQPYSTDPAELNLPNQLYNTMTQAVSVFDRQSSPWISVAHPPLPMIKTLSNKEYDYGSRPKVAITPSNIALELHTNGNDGMFRDTLSFPSNQVSTLKMYGYYQDGEDPTATVLSDGQTIIEVHGGYNKNNIYYNIMKLDGSTLSNISNNGDDYDKGENPCIASSYVDGQDRIFEVHRDASATSTKLYYNTATWNGSSLSWDKNGTNRQYASGEYPAIAFATNQTTLIEAHATKPINTIFDGGDVIDNIIYACAGATSTSSVSFSSSINMMSGTTPTIAVRTGDTIVIFAELNNRLVYSIGKLQDTYISWTICGQRWAQGQRPGLGRLSNNTLVLVYENTAANPSGQMYGAILDLVVPTGFNVA